MSDGELITDVAAMHALAVEWDALAVSTCNPVTTPAWVLSWWRHVAAPDFEPRVVVLRDHGTLVGVAPFYLSHTQRGLRECRLMGSDFGVCMQPLALPGREWDLARTIGELLAQSQPCPDVLEFGPMTLASHWITAVSVDWPGPVRAPAHRHRVDGAPVILLREPSFDAWFASLSSKMRRTLRRIEREFEQAGGSTRWSTAQTLRADAQAFARLHTAGRWGERGSRLTDLGDRLVDWIEDLGRENERMRMCVLELDGVPICVDFGLCAGDQLAQINSAWDESRAELSPARLAVLRVVESAFEHECRQIHLGLGNFEHKLRLANGNDPVAWTTLIAPTRRLPLTYAHLLPGLARKRVRDAAERALPEQWFERARTMRHSLLP